MISVVLIHNKAMLFSYLLLVRYLHMNWIVLFDLLRMTKSHTDKSKEREQKKVYLED